MKTLLYNKVKVRDIEIDFSISFFNTNSEHILNVITRRNNRQIINHTELFTVVDKVKLEKSEVRKTFNDRKKNYIVEILKAIKDYDNRRT